ncbi:hypothetical protein L1987_44044 [Smallanthus sonchifolius]|uniref:Uncharacterized protein n=1 Tax=Smallanthus sonchifolius TaxID=185202 RepID=A0ACB9GPC4_9ASTR|nr:hypothetical protein L1987_44044 [Smallanthus sonchifolius]
METARSDAGSFAQTEINWDKLDKTKFYVVGGGIFSGLTVVLYPISVVKTRLQVATKDCREECICCYQRITENRRRTRVIQRFWHCHHRSNSC